MNERKIIQIAVIPAVDLGARGMHSHWRAIDADVIPAADLGARGMDYRAIFALASDGTLWALPQPGIHQNADVKDWIPIPRLPRCDHFEWELREDDKLVMAYQRDQEKVLRKELDKLLEMKNEDGAFKFPDGTLSVVTYSVNEDLGKREKVASIDARKF